MLTAIETTGTVNANHQIVLDDELPDSAPSRVRVIVLFEDESDLSESEWARSASNNDVFEFLKDDTENIYSVTDGKPLENEE